MAERFPWVDAYTPVNEPLTTARFSGLYGHWYPHGRDDATFVRALLDAVPGDRAGDAGRSARCNPAPRLVQTEDLARPTRRARSQYQADFENERRWLSWDLLCGRVDRRHPLRELPPRRRGDRRRELAGFLDQPVPARRPRA